MCANGVCKSDDALHGYRSLFFFVLILRYTDMAPCALVIVSTSNLSINGCVEDHGQQKRHLVLLNEEDIELMVIIIMSVIAVFNLQ